MHINHKVTKTTMPLTLYDTLTREKRMFEPLDPSRVTLYVCGPTVYSYAHIGNARPPVVFDVLFRLLRRAYGEDGVVYARNITDVDDKIIEASKSSGEPIPQITARFEAIYLADMGALGVLPPTFAPHATAHIDDMIAMMKTLEAKGHAYQTATGLLFHVPSMGDYGKLSGRDRDGMIAGARVDVADGKRDPADFSLWKLAKPGEPEEAIWDSPWGRGRPGWHIECSAMIAAVLGKTIDIHAGGIDLQFPHQDNEIAQSECAHGAPFANYWLHNGFLDLDGEKMSKSLGNVRLVHQLLAEWPGEVLRFALLSGHYRQPLDFSRDLLDQAKATLDRLYGALGRVWSGDADEDAMPPAAFLEALNDDLNTPRALAELSALAGEANKAADARRLDRFGEIKGRILAAGSLIGLLNADPEDWFKSGGASEDVSKIEALVAARFAARQAKDWAEADRLRAELASLGVEVLDGPSGSTWRRS